MKHFARRRTTLVTAGILVIFLLVCAFVFLRPSPPPNIQLTFKGIRKWQTNTLAEFCLTNGSGKSIWWEGSYSIVPESPGSAQMESDLLGWSARIKPSSNITMDVIVPAEVLIGGKSNAAWHLAFKYIFYSPYSERSVMKEDFLAAHPKDKSSASSKAILWCIEHLPEPKQCTGTLSSVGITNLPPGEFQIINTR
jgi:hypothetical protein